MTPQCTARNGTYVCHRSEGHLGPHKSVFESAGQARSASWEPGSPVVFKTFRP